MKPEFTAHNIRLADGTETLPGGPTIDRTPLFVSSLRAFRLTTPTGDGRRPRIADLGSLEAGYSIELARAGYDVVAIEGRELNHDAATWALERTEVADHVTLVCDDARNLANYGTFDGVLCCGLLYHLDDPVAMLRTISEVSQTLMLHTLFSRRFFLSTVPGRYSSMTTNEGVRGRWAGEFAANANAKEKAVSRWSSLDNTRSFWIEHDQLVETLGAVGYDAVFEQYDHLLSWSWGFRDRMHRGLFVATKTGLPSTGELLGSRPPRMTDVRLRAPGARFVPSIPRQLVRRARALISRG